MGKCLGQGLSVHQSVCPDKITVLCCLGRRTHRRLPAGQPLRPCRQGFLPTVQMPLRRSILFAWHRLASAHVTGIMICQHTPLQADGHWLLSEHGWATSRHQLGHCLHEPSEGYCCPMSIYQNMPEYTRICPVHRLIGIKSCFNQR